MRDFRDKVAVITGGGTGMGRQLARQLAAEGCHLALCDLSQENMEQTLALCREAGGPGLRTSATVADVSVESDLEGVRDAVLREHETDCVHLVFNNAGIGAAGSLIADEREDWERTFDVNWLGVYFGTRVFLPLLMAAPEAHLVNTSSVNGFWASLGPKTAHTSYSAAKFAVKGFTEALINDFRNHAPHVKVSVVMPGHIGTDIIKNSARILGRDPKELSEDELEEARQSIVRLGFDVGGASPEEIRQLLVARAELFRDDAPMSAAEAAGIILEGVREERWRILVGEDAQVLDRLVRETPEEAYESEFMDRFVAQSGWKLSNT